MAGPVSASGGDPGKDPVFLVMVSGQIESAEVSKVEDEAELLVQDWYNFINLTSVPTSYTGIQTY